MIHILSFFLPGIAIGFPIPYFGIVTMKGSLFKVVSPLIDLKYNENITENFKFPSPKRFPRGFLTELCNPNILPYFDKETLVLLYLDSKSKAVRYDVTNGNHRTIMGSVSPNEHAGTFLHVRLGKGSFFSENIIFLLYFEYR